VVGAGIQGAGVAQAAAAAGYRVLVLEQTAVAAGTSSQSSKLIHGGLRYLETGQFRLVREALSERAHLLANAPDLVRLVAFYLPIYRSSQRKSWQIRCGLAMYQALGGLRPETEFDTVPRRDWHTLDGLVTDDLVAVYRYYDGQTDDALLTQAVIDSAVSMGAEVRMPAEFVAAKIEDQECQVIYRDGGHDSPAPRTEQTCRSRVLVNCAGPWANRLLEQIDPPQQTLAVDLVQGSHLWLTLPAPQAVYYLEAPRDRRGVLAIPWYGEMLLGTTETLYEGPPEEAHTLPAETSYLLDTLGHYFPKYRDLGDDKIRKQYCGLRVLPHTGANPFRRSRDVMIHCDDARAPRLVSVMGGKLTTYRRTAQRVMARIAAQLPPPKSRLDTAKIQLLPR
jgi:glycerol-3-phosphate dehydrogenase